MQINAVNLALKKSHKECNNLSCHPNGSLTHFANNKIPISKVSIKGKFLEIFPLFKVSGNFATLTLEAERR
jgi:hypothetical protein